MLALAAAVMFLVAAIKVGTSVVSFWLYLGLFFWALSFAYDWFGGPRGNWTRRNNVP